MGNDLVSIIIPCYNDFQFIEYAVNSASCQTYENKEIIVIDDGSDSKTKAVLQKLKDSIDLLIIQENNGQSAARNAGIKKAKGEYIFVLDSDDFAEPTFCEIAVQLFKNATETKLVSCYANLIYPDNTITIYIPEGGPIKNFLFKNAALGTSMFRKEDWVKAGGYDETMRNGWEDWEFFIRLLKNGGEAMVINEPLYNYRKRSHSTTAIANEFKNGLYSYIINKHSDLYKQNFTETIAFLLRLIENTKKSEQKRINSIEFKVGKTVLNPFRKIKSLFKFNLKS